MTLGEASGYGALAAAVTVVIAGVTLALFFGGAGAFWGPVNDVFVAITVLLLIPAIVAVTQLAPDDTRPWFTAVSVAAIGGAVVMAAGQLLLVAGVIGLNASFVTGGVGVLPFLVWMGALAWLVLARQAMDPAVGYLIVAVLASAAALTVSAAILPMPITTVTSVALLALLVAWMVVLSGELRTLG